MSTPDREPQAPGPLKYAPKWARTAAPAPAGDRPADGPRAGNIHPPERKPVSAPRPASQHRPASERGPALERGPAERKPAAPPQQPAPPSPPREPAPPWKLAKQRGTFEGDVAIKELRERMALAPDQPPEPPMREDRGAVFGMVGRLSGLVALAAVAAYGFVWFSAPGEQGQGFAPATAQNSPFGQRAAPAVSRASLSPAGLNGGSFKPAVFQPPAAKAATRPSPDEAPAVDRPQLLAPVPWPDAGRDLADEPHETVTTGAAVLAAVPAPHAAAPLTPAEAAIATAPATARIEDLATFLARGRMSLANGDVAAARLVFRRAADGGDAQAALALGGTFDPLVLKSLGAIGVAADPDQARNWYQKAAELGSRDAPQRLDQLARSTR
jgi:hypothetical protein